MTTIGFVRHGVTAWNKEGRAQEHYDIMMRLGYLNLHVSIHQDIVYTVQLK